jgi:hypothetical protein
MKYLILLLSLLWWGLLAGQTVDGYDIRNLDAPYIEIVGVAKFMSNKVTVTIDYGQEAKFFSDQRVMDADGRPVVFYSMIDALNFFAYLDYEFAQAYTVTIGNQNVYHYLLRKVYYVED